MLFQLVALRVSVSAAIPSVSELDSSYSFDDYLDDFEKEYQDGDYDRRKDIFEKNLKDIPNQCKYNIIKINQKILIFSRTHTYVQCKIFFFDKFTSKSFVIQAQWRKRSRNEKLKVS